VTYNYCPQSRPESLVAQITENKPTVNLMLPVKSKNFEFLRGHYEALADLAAYAELYTFSDPASSLVKLRTFTELLVKNIYKHADLKSEPGSKLNDLLRTQNFEDIIPEKVRLKLNVLRDNGNKAAHGKTVKPRTALWVLSETYDIARWFAKTYLELDSVPTTEYQAPVQGEEETDSKAQLKRKNKELIQRLAKLEGQVSKTQATTASASISFLQASAPDNQYRDGPVPEKSVSLEQAKAKGAQIADELEFNEETTRTQLIDSQLVSSGWDVGEGGENTSSVTQEEEVGFQPTDTGVGYADYVLWGDDGKPLAVIEVKKTVEHPEKGQTQARLYAEGFAKQNGQHPIIFFTNGFDIWVWDDQQKYPPRKIFAFYSKDSLEYLLYQRKNKKALNSVEINSTIVERPFAHESIKRVAERFEKNHRKALIVQATGTGKTRVAIALSDLLVRANWAKRILFLCDRRELRRQAKNAFNEFTSLPLMELTKSTVLDTHHRVFLATYPAMLRQFRFFDPGFFDLIIADESHRSIYNVYGDLFKYFDSLQVGLTATPVGYVTRNTFRMFDCEDQNPTFYYSYERAVEEGYLVPYEVVSVQTAFQRRGIKYDEMTPEQIEALQAQGEDATVFDYSARQLDSMIFNKDTNRLMLKNLMEQGIKDAQDQNIGKSIIFSRNHKHAILLRQLFDELYPQYGGRFCQVIDNYDPRAEQLIDDFKDAQNPLTIAISVDMLDTGVDIPEVVNLVFAKPIGSPVKFMQMIGRGTRLCENLLGDGEDKKAFRIFDHWANFEAFEFGAIPVEPKINKSLMQQLFEVRVDLAANALTSVDRECFDKAIKLIEGDIRLLPEDSIAVREKWRVHRALMRHEVLDQFSPATHQALLDEIAPLMQWVALPKESVQARAFDLLMTRLQKELMLETSAVDDLRVSVMDKVNGLLMNLNPVKEKFETIKRVRSSDFWTNLTQTTLETTRIELREIIHHQQSSTPPSPIDRVVDIPEDETLIQSERRATNMPQMDMKVYKQQIEQSITDIKNSDPVLQKIRDLKPITEADVEHLVSLVHTRNGDVPIEVLRGFFSTTDALSRFFRGITGLNAEAVAERFDGFIKSSSLNADQTRFLTMVKAHLVEHGTITIDRLYEAPFTRVSSDGVVGVFPDDGQFDQLVKIVESFEQSNPVNEP
jgi:type I restriction enzyme, R subunit